MQELLYQNKTVLITGASRGMGLAIAQHFLKGGARVIGLSKGASTLTNENYTHFSVDLSNNEEITFCFRKQIAPKFKSIDIVINNAAVLTSQYSMVIPAQNVIDMVNINLLGVFFVSREAARLMLKSKWGRIVNISSMAVSLEPVGDAMYAATKVAINTLANVMAKEFSSMNVTCNTLGITAIDTDMLRSHSETAQIKIKEIIGNMPVPRIAQIEDITNVIDFYVSEASSYITAQTIYLGGIN